jgi:hypothetical protein
MKPENEREVDGTWLAEIERPSPISKTTFLAPGPGWVGA